MMGPSGQATNEDLSLDSDTSSFLEESGDPEQQSVDLSGVVTWVAERYQRAKDARREKERVWRRALTDYRGEYGPDVQFREDEKSRVFVRLTANKVNAAFHQIVDVLYSGGSFPISIEPTAKPEGIIEDVSFDPQAPAQAPAGAERKTPPWIARPDLLGPLAEDLAPVQERLEEGPGGTPTAVTFSPADAAARAMEDLIRDQLQEANAGKKTRAMVFEQVLFGTGVVKGPFITQRETPNWEPETGEYTPDLREVPDISHVSLWNAFVDPDARSGEDATYVVERHRMSRSDMWRLKRRPYFREESINLAVKRGYNYVLEDYEHDLQAHSDTGEIERFEVLEYWGLIDAEMAEEAGLEVPEGGGDMLQVNVWICNGLILRLVANPYVPQRIPYLFVPYEIDPYSPYGVGIAEKAADTQLLCNGFMRLAVDNAALSSNLIIEVDESNLVPGQDMTLRPGLILRRQAGAVGQGMTGIKLPNVTQETLLLFDKARQLMDESTGIPSYSHGMSGVMSTGRTASGMSMLMNAASQNIKGVVRNLDDFFLAPLGQAFFQYNMQFAEDEKVRGDLKVVARGTESLMRNEIRSQRLLQFLQLTGNQALAPFANIFYLLKEIAASMDLDEEKAVNDPGQAAIQAEIMKSLGVMPGGPGEAPGGNPAAMPGAGDPTGTGGGNIAPGQSPEPGAQGFTGGGGGDNGGGAAPSQANVRAA